MFLLDTTDYKVKSRQQQFPSLVGGQLITPLTRRSNWGGAYAIDNGAFSGFQETYFKNILTREEGNRDRCLFVVMPDVVGDARRTLEIWQRRSKWAEGWPRALVAQDGLEDLEVPWDEIDALFIGGGDPWKDSKASLDLVRTAKILGKHVHVGRVNDAARFQRFAELGADTCDGSGASMYDHMLEKIQGAVRHEPHPELAL